MGGEVERERLLSQSCRWRTGPTLSDATPAASYPFAVLQVSLLGPLEVRRDGEVVSIPGGKTAEVLVRLALDAGVLVRADRLVEDLWADDAVTTSRNTLQSKIAKLRRALASAPELISGDGGYLLEVDPAEVDAFAVPHDAAGRGAVARRR